mmetsp:Transcript_22996/g.66336  ORF Transcript_22996/g.66336 Transcript_22996/m.66336 type:complete len:169 (-) Transcript_22996:195-701(-)
MRVHLALAIFASRVLGSPAWEAAGSGLAGDSVALVQLSFRPKVVLHGSFLTGDKSLCWEVPRSQLRFTTVSLSTSPLSELTADAVLSNSSCFEQGYRVQLAKLDPCFKETVLYKLDMTDNAKLPAASAYRTKVDKQHSKIFQHCFKEMGPVAKLLGNSALGKMARMAR